MGKRTSKVRPRTGHEDPEVEQRYSSTLSSFGARWGWVANTTPRPLYPRERDPMPIVQDAGWAGAGNLFFLVLSLSTVYLYILCPPYPLCTFISSVLLSLIPLQHKHPCPRQDSNPQFQQASGHSPTPWTAWPPRSADSIAGLSST